ncbi:two-component system sensor histidine kinase KdpD [Mobilisporobacter senegalensis]|uniref:histidine kinase n=1 Tax=Mobilisporobacter senegalensis TaxID=1329262 RepID=A0A3N1XTB8_9FIRM|nr:DUF4118 domain-containing protein [Mobilisporobacter senegalensis]ROR29411.1 two-component system sensor histidine kinase KdpD [Mobilisporobacter senegalensis]
MDKITETRKFLVCIGSSPTSAKCIYWAEKNAETFSSAWTAVYVESDEGLYLKDSEKKSLQSNMELATQLGGEVVTLNGHNIAMAVAEYAKRTGTTDIAVGKSRNKKTFINIFKLDLEDKLMSLLPDVEIHVLPDHNITKTYRKNPKILLIKPVLTWKDTGITLFTLICASVISLFLNRIHIENENMILMYILSVLIISRVTTGYIYGVAGSVFSVLIFNYLFAEPYYSFIAIQKGDLITFTIMLFVALTTSTLTVRVKAQANYAFEREKRTEILYEINKKLLVTTGLTNIVHLTNEYIIKIFRRSVIFYISDPFNGAEGILMKYEEEEDMDFMMSEAEKAVAHWVFLNQKRAGAGTEVQMASEVFYIPVISRGQVLGVIGLSCMNGSFIDQNNLLFLRMIVSIAAMALERQQLSDKQRIILVQSEKEKMRSNLLRAVSHDLRTPLTGILGASSTILENSDTLDKDTKLNLISNIKEESQWLIRMVENLLSVTRINGESSEVRKCPEAAEEIVAAAIGRTRKRFKDCKINVKVPDELLIVPMDGILIEQVIINLLENAIKHSGVDIEINVDVKKEQDTAIFEISDNGEGITEQDLPYLLDNFNPKKEKASDSSRGMGIGLSICMSIIKAHHGKMEVENNISGGAIFRFALPLEGGTDSES